MKKYLFLLLIIALSSACSRSFYKITENELPDPLITDTILLDNTYEVYIRNNKVKNEYYKNEDGSDTKNYAREIQFLFIKNDDVIYIPTIPSRYLYDKLGEEGYMVDTIKPNIFYFNNFFFGKINKDRKSTTFIFKNDKGKESWNVELSNPNFTLVSIDNYKTRKVRENNTITIKDFYIGTESSHPILNESIDFILINNFDGLSYLLNGDAKKEKKFYTYKLIKVYKDATKTKLDYVLFSFDDYISPNVKNIKFDSKRILYY